MRGENVPIGRRPDCGPTSGDGPDGLVFGPQGKTVGGEVSGRDEDGPRHGGVPSSGGGGGEAFSGRASSRKSARTPRGTESRNQNRLGLPFFLARITQRIPERRLQKSRVVQVMTRFRPLAVVRTGKRVPPGIDAGKAETALPRLWKTGCRRTDEPVPDARRRIFPRRGEPGVRGEARKSWRFGFWTRAPWMSFFRSVRNGYLPRLKLKEYHNRRTGSRLPAVAGTVSTDRTVSTTRREGGETPW